MKWSTYNLMIIFIIVLNGSNFYPQLKSVMIEGIKSEGNYYIKDRIIYSDAVVLEFNANVIPLNKGISIADFNNINPNYLNIKKLFSQLEQQYGEIKIEKVIPNTVWGDNRENESKKSSSRIHDFSQLFYIHFSNPVPLDSIINLFEIIPEVEFAHGPIIYEYNNSPNDFYYQQGIQWNLDVIDSENAWDLTHGDSSIKIAIIDEGINENHIDLQGKIVGGSGYYNSNQPHGTWVAGVLGATTNNNNGIASLGWGLNLYNFGGPQQSHQIR